MQRNRAVARDTSTLAEYWAVNDEQLRTTASGKVEPPIDAVPVKSMPNVGRDRTAARRRKVKILKGVQETNLIFLVEQMIKPNLSIELLAIDQTEG